jgi:hypothetical protein
MTMYHVLNKVPTGNEEIAPFKEWEKKILIFLTHKYEVVWTNRMCQSTRSKSLDKTVDCVFHGCAFNNVDYIF